MIKEDTQCGKILKKLRDAKGAYVNGRTFLRDLYISQFHARIFSLINDGYKIETSPFRDEFGFCSYKLVEQPEQQPLI